jgi:ribosomal protein L11 methyltransferase
VAWQQLTLHINAADLPRTEVLLRLAGAVSVAISDDSGTPILEPEPGTTPLWPSLAVRALFADGLDLGNIRAVLGPVTASDPALDRLEDEDLERAGRELIRPVRIGPRLTIVPSAELGPDSDTELGLHMGLAFGTGQHPTTRLCLEWLEGELAAGGSVLDYGCGTGVLALAALRLGARTATAIDIEPQALAATRRNAELNRLDSRIAIGPPAMLGSGRFDLILANILAQPLIALAEDFARRQAPGGRVVLSGILESQLDAVETHYGRWYEQTARHERAGWGLLTGSRRGGYDR